jgi:hypothetical protein
MPVKELESYLGMKLLKPEEEEDIDTLGGLVFSLVGRVPARGELVRHPSGLEFEILDADPRRVKKLRVHPPRAAPRRRLTRQGLTAAAQVRSLRLPATLRVHARRTVHPDRWLRVCRLSAAGAGAGLLLRLARCPCWRWRRSSRGRCCGSRFPCWCG